MDNLIVSSVSIGSLYLCDVLPQAAFPEVTPLAIVAVCVYYFLSKFDKKMDALMERTEKIEDYIDIQKEKEKEERNHAK